MRTKSPIELRDLLGGIFPEFASACPAEDSEANATFHAVLFDFAPYFSGNREQFSEKQIKALAAFLNDAASVNDELENAVATCFLEHLGQLRSYKILAPHLSKLAKEKTHA